MRQSAAQAAEAVRREISPALAVVTCPRHGKHPVLECGHCRGLVIGSADAARWVLPGSRLPRPYKAGPLPE